MNEYRKIPNMFKFDAKYQTIVGTNEPFKSLENLIWIGTEKVDGTNVRVHWDGHTVEVKGRTDNAQFQGELFGYLEQKFLTKEAEYIFEQNFGEKDVVIYGEGYGPKIQAGGGLYSTTPKFIAFDIDIDHTHLKRKNFEDVCNKLMLDFVPIVFTGTLNEAKEYVASHPMSTINSDHEMEGIVLELPLDIYDQKGWRIKCKCKYRDMLKAGLTNKNL